MKKKNESMFAVSIWKFVILHKFRDVKGNKNVL